MYIHDIWQYSKLGEIMAILPFIWVPFFYSDFFLKISHKFLATYPCLSTLFPFLGIQSIHNGICAKHGFLSGSTYWYHSYKHVKIELSKYERARNLAKISLIDVLIHIMWENSEYISLFKRNGLREIFKILQFAYADTFPLLYFLLFLFTFILLFYPNAF